MNVQESRQLKAGDQVCQSSNHKDTGAVIENSADNVLIEWKDGTRTLTAHAGMGHVTRVVERRLGVTLLKLAPVFALVLGLGLYYVKSTGSDAVANPVVVQKMQAPVIKIDPQLTSSTTEEQWAVLKQQEVTP